MQKSKTSKSLESKTSNNRVLQYINSFLFYKRFIITFLLLFIFLSVINNLYFIIEIIRLNLGFELILQTMLDFSNFQSAKLLIAYFVLLLFMSLNMSLLLKFMEEQKKIFLIKDKKFSFIESIKNFTFFIFTMLFSHCASCGLILFGGLFSFGASAFLINYGIYLQISAILIVTINIYYLIKKINRPFVC